MTDLGKYMIPAVEAMSGISEGKLRVVGSVVRFAAGPLKGKIHSHLQETGMTGPLLESLMGGGKTFATATMAGGPVAGSAAAFADVAVKSAAVAQNEAIRRGVNRVENKVDALDIKLGNVTSSMTTLNNLGIANLALSGVGIGVMMIGFGVMNARISGIESELASLTDRTDQIIQGIERIRQDQIASEFSELRSQISLYEEAWHLEDHTRATQLWMAISTTTRSYQDKFTNRARELLFTMPPEFALADPMVDAVALAGGLRVACLMACNESGLAMEVANENARQVESLTGNVGLADMVMRLMPARMDAGSQEWDHALTQAVSTTEPLVAKWRQREALAATRGACLPQLAKDGIAPRDWLGAAREEKKEPVLLLAATAEE